MMRKRLFWATVAVYFCLANVAQSANDPINKFIDQHGEGNTYIERMYAAYLKQNALRSGVKPYYLINKLNARQSDALLVYLQGQEARIAVQQFLGDIELAEFYYGSNANVGRTELFALQALRSTGDLRRVIDGLENAARREAREALAATVRNYTASGGDLKALRAMSPAEQYATLYSQPLPIRDDQIPVVDRPRLQPAAEGFLKAAIRETGLVNVAANLSQTHNNYSLTNLAKVSAAFLSITQMNLSAPRDLVAAQLEAKNAFGRLVDNASLTQGIGANPEDLKNAAELISGDRPPADVIRDVVGRHASGPLSSAVELQKAFAASHANLNEKLTTYLGAANTAVDIAENVFHVDRTVVTAISKGVSATKTVNAAINSIMSGNFIGATTSIVGGIFGGILGEGPDPAEARHQELLSRMDSLKDDVQDVKKGIDELKRGQLALSKQIEEMKNEIRNSLSLIEDNANKRYSNIMDALDILYRQTIAIQTLIIDSAVDKPIRDCDSFLELAVTKGGRDPQSGLFPSLQMQQDFLEGYGTSFYKPCFEGLKDLLPVRVDTVPYLWLRTKSGEVLPDIEQKEKVINEAWSIIKQKKDVEQMYKSLLLPVRSLNEANRKRSLLNKVPGVAPAANTELFTKGIWNREVILRISDKLTKIHYFAHLAKAQNYLDWKKVVEINPSTFQPVPETLLLNNLKLINSAIAQVSLMEGDTLLPELYDMLFSGKPDLLKKGATILFGNRGLQRNFAAYAIHRDLARKSLLQYAYALSSTVDTPLKELLGNKYVLTRKVSPELGETWSFSYGPTLAIALPSADILAAESLYISPELAELLDLRSRIISEIGSYDLMRDMSPSLKRNWLASLVAGVEVPIDRVTSSRDDRTATGSRPTER
jgi:hypothetical protein